MKDMSDKLYTCSEIATILSRHRADIWYHIHKLKINYTVKRGRIHYFDTEAVTRLMLVTGAFRDLTHPASDWLEVAVNINIRFERQYISANAAAVVLGYAAHYFAQMLKCNDGPSTFLFNNRRYYLRSELRDWVEIHKPDRIVQLIGRLGFE